ncbi:hypothetical protein AJ87_37740 [Rhizobium yanglingense]|nr:hypothetical protein AJ87_37740 [Rhizobium yanglingense]
MRPGIDVEAAVRCLYEHRVKRLHRRVGKEREDELRFQRLKAFAGKGPVDVALAGGTQASRFGRIGVIGGKLLA